jgi:putative membrane protein
MRLLIRWLLSAVALLAVTYLYHGVQLTSYGSALLAAAVIGLLNTFVRPVLVVLTLPVTIITLGLFLFVINALLFWAASGMLSGFHVNGFVAALVGSLLYSILHLVIEALLGGLLSSKR